MFMRGNRDMNISKGWQECPFFYKVLVLTTLPIALVGIFSGVFLNALVMVPSLVSHFQIWRLFTSWMVEMSIINTLFGLLMLYYYFPPREQKFGTVYAWFDFIVMTTLIQLGICLLQFIGSLFLQNINLFGLGLWPMVFVYMSRTLYEDPQAEIPFCCLPCNIKKKYYPVGILLIFSLLGGIRPGDLLGFSLGLMEYLVFNNVLIRYPLSWIMTLEGCTPNIIQRRSDFISSSKCYNNLRGVCRGDPLEGREAQPAIGGNGVVIGHGNGPVIRNQNDLRQFWANKGQQSPEEIRHQMNDTMMSDNSSRNFK